MSGESGQGSTWRSCCEQRATVFLLGAEETQAAPLVCALTGHIAREARRLAALQPGGRLDPPLTLALDEAALISPVPLESWTADMGGRGVTILAAFQSRAQLLARWGEHDAATILNNTGAVMVFGGTRDRDDLQFWSTLTGERDEPITTPDLHGRGATRTVRRVPVLQPAQIANLPAGRVLVIRRGLAPVIGRAQMAWRRRDVRAHQHACRPGRRGGRARRTSAATDPVPVPISGEGEWEIPADWFADTAMPAPDDGDESGSAGDDGELRGGPMTAIPPQNTRRGNSRPTASQRWTREGQPRTGPAAVADRPRPRRGRRLPRPVDPRRRTRPRLGDDCSPAARHTGVGRRG